EGRAARPRGERSAWTGPGAVMTTELEQVPMFAELSDEQLAGIRERSTERLVTAGKEIISQGEHSDELFIVLEGSVKISRHRPDGREVIISVLGAGEVVGDVLREPGADQSSSVVALENTHVVSMHRDTFRSLLRDMP